MPTHGFGIIGCGMIAEYHARAIAEIPGARVAAAYSRSPANGAKIADLATGDCPVYDDLDALLAHPRPGRRLHLHPQRRPPGAGAGGGAGGQACGGREAAGSDFGPLRRDHRRLRRRGRPPRGDLPVAVQPGERGAEGGRGRGAVREADVGQHLCKMVAVAGVLRLRRLAGHPGPRRRRDLDESGDPQRRPAAMADGGGWRASRP